jgi:hypothetical protein
VKAQLRSLQDLLKAVADGQIIFTGAFNALAKKEADVLEQLSRTVKPASEQTKEEENQLP